MTAGLPAAPTRRRLLGLAPALIAAGCGFAPLHAPSRGAPSRGAGLAVAVDPVPGEAGFALRERLLERLGSAPAPTHRLAVDLVLRTEGAAITRDSFTTRYLVLGEAAFRLTPAGAAEPLVEETVTARTAYSVPTSETASAYAARVAALDAEERLARMLADRIALRIALLGAAGSPARPGG